MVTDWGTLYINGNKMHPCGLPYGVLREKQLRLKIIYSPRRATTILTMATDADVKALIEARSQALRRASEGRDADGVAAWYSNDAVFEAPGMNYRKLHVIITN